MILSVLIPMQQPFSTDAAGILYPFCHSHRQLPFLKLNCLDICYRDSCELRELLLVKLQFLSQSKQPFLGCFNAAQRLEVSNRRIHSIVTARKINTIWPRCIKMESLPDGLDHFWSDFPL